MWAVRGMCRSKNKYQKVIMIMCLEKKLALCDQNIITILGSIFYTIGGTYMTIE